MGRRWRFLCAVVAVVAAGAPACADQPPLSQSYRKITPGGEYVFVMLDPLRGESCVRWSESTTADVREIHRKYSLSGLYRNDGSAEPLWTVGWYADQHGVDVTSDGVHLIRVNQWVKSPDAEVVGFFAGGQLLRSYSYRDLVGDRLDHSSRTVSGYVSVFPVGRLAERRYEFVLDHVDGGRFVFDVRTGSMVSEFRSSRPIRWGWWAGLGLTVLVAAWVIESWLVRRRAAKKAKPATVPDSAI